MWKPYPSHPLNSGTKAKTRILHKMDATSWPIQRHVVTLIKDVHPFKVLPRRGDASTTSRPTKNPKNTFKTHTSKIWMLQLFPILIRFCPRNHSLKLTLPYQPTLTELPKFQNKIMKSTHIDDCLPTLLPKLNLGRHHMS